MEVMSLSTGRLTPVAEVEEHPIYEEGDLMEVELTDSASDWEQIGDQTGLSLNEMLNRQEVMSAMHQGSLEAIRHVQRDMTPTMGALTPEQLAIEDQEL